MPERKNKPKAPAGRVYKSAQPLRQAKLPNIRTRVRGYGNSSVRKVPSLQKQDTLTQMDFVKMADEEFYDDLDQSDVEDEEEGGVGLESVHETPAEEQEEEEVLPRRNLRPKRLSSTSPQKRYRRVPSSPSPRKIVVGEAESKSVPKSNKRRRTMNDLPPESEEEEYHDSGRKKTKSAKKTKTSRRKTVGDQPLIIRQKSLGPQYLTQTITQLHWGVLPPREELHAEDEVDEGDSDIFDVPNSSQILNATKRRGRMQSPELGAPVPVVETARRVSERNSDRSNVDVRGSPTLPQPRRSTRTSSESLSPQKMQSEPGNASNGTMGPPQTPKRVRVQEIPSSESPATPQFLKSGGSQGRSPLKEVSFNTAIPFNPNSDPRKTPKLVIEDTFDTGTDISQALSLSRQSSDVSSELPKLPRMVIEDTFEGNPDISQMRRLPSTPAKKSSPSKSVRFALSDTDASSPLVEKTQKTVTFAKSIILDSDDDDEDYAEESQVDESQDSQRLAVEPDTCYGDFGDETQHEADQLVSTATSNHHSDLQTTNQCIKHQMSKDREPSSTLTQPTQLLPSSPPDAMDEDDNDHDSHYHDKTQFRASQRLHTQHLHNFAPRTLDSDIFVSIASAQMTDIIDQKRTHDIRAYAYPTGTTRIWFYVAKPICKLVYMAVIGSGKKPGEIDKADEGTGSKAFNKKGAAWRAYEIEELYELADPLTMGQLKENEWLQAPPKKFERVRPVVISILIANLMPPTFSKHEYNQESVDEDYEPSQQEEESMHPYTYSSFNDTQDATEQLLSTIKQFTQFGTSTQPVVSSQVETPKALERIPSSQDEAMLPPLLSRSAVKHSVLSQATTVDLTQTQHHTQITTPRKLKPEPIDDVVWESPSRPVHSLNTTPARPHRSSSDVNMAGGESFVVPMSIPSSQMLTRSQMEDEIVFDSIPPPPGQYMDSDEEDEIEDDF